MNHNPVAILAQAKHHSLNLEAQRARQLHTSLTQGRMTFGR